MMRPVGLSDLDDAVRAVLAVRVADRAATAVRLVGQACVADRYRKRLGRRHPAWGDGTLSAAARAGPMVAASGWCDRDYRAALAVMLAALA
ncbi:hypothetical protein GLR48_13595 [Loktanella sp. M215]|nr:hypothetical protein [Loktanella sp. M215]